MALVDTLLANFQEAQDRAREANEKRYQQGLDIFDRIIERYKEGGTFLEGTEAQLERGRTKSVAQGMQALVSSGLVSTTQAAGLGKKFEEEVGAPVRLQAQDIAFERLAGAETQKAGFIERREDVGPDYATIASLMQTIGQGQQQTPARSSQSRGFSFGQSANQAAINQRKFQAREAELSRQFQRDQQRRAAQSTPEALAASERRGLMRFISSQG